MKKTIYFLWYYFFYTDMWKLQGCILRFHSVYGFKCFFYINVILKKVVDITFLLLLVRIMIIMLMIVLLVMLLFNKVKLEIWYLKETVLSLNLFTCEMLQIAGDDDTDVFLLIYTILLPL